MRKLTASIIMFCLLLGILNTVDLYSASAETNAEMLNNLRNSSFFFCGQSYAGKKNTMIEVAEKMLDAGFEPAFVAGALGNVAKEGSCGMFENVFGYSKSFVSTNYGSNHNYIAHMNGWTEWCSHGHDHSEYRQYAGKVIYNGFSLSAVSNMLDRYKNEGWLATFGLGCLQWTWAETIELVNYYKNEVGSSDTITYSQCVSAEARMIANKLRNSYAYSYWKSQNASNLGSADAAYSAGYEICVKYEIPADKINQGQMRGNIAREILIVMLPSSQYPDYLTDPIVYNADYYRERYSDLQAAFGNDDAALLDHWLTCGLNQDEGRVASPVFDAPWYLSHNSDVNSVYEGKYTGAAEHFVKFGVAEGRQGSEEFALWCYKANYIDLQNAFGDDNYQYYWHYVVAGRSEGRIANKRLTISFDANGGNVSTSSIEVTNGAVIGSMPQPTREGYNFLGWYTQKEGGRLITAETMMDYPSMQKLYAHWESDYVPVSSVSIVPDSITMNVGATYELSATVSPSNATNKNVMWSSNKTSVATISNGTVTAKTAGTATITVTTEDQNKTATCTVNVIVPTVPVASISLSKASLSLNVGQAETLTATINPSNATNKGVTWSSNKTSVATVSNGIITAKSAGTATITCEAMDGSGIKATCEVIVIELIPEFILPAGLIEIEEEAFAGINAQRVTVPDGVQKIGKRAFAGCTKLKYVYIPEATTQIATDAFSDVASGFEIHGKLNSYAQTYASQNGFTFVADDACTITFNANGGSCSTTSKTVNIGSAIGTLPSASRSYYTFNGWYTAATGGSKVSASSTFTSSTTLYAQWTEHEWSEWVTEDQLPSGTIQKESKQQYRYQDKVYSEWSDWGPWTLSPESTGELKKQHQSTVYYWYYDLCQNCGKHSPFTTCWDCGHSIGANWQVAWFDISKNEGGQFGNSGKVFIGTNEYNRWFFWTDDNGNGDERTGYQYATRTYTWGNWSEWSDTYVISSTTRNVDGRYVYRYKLP